MAEIATLKLVNPSVTIRRHVPAFWEARSRELPFGLKGDARMGAAFESSVLASRTSAEPAVTSHSDQADFCPNCRSPFEIVTVKFSNGTAVIVACPNCAIACKWRAAESLDNAKTLAINAQGFWRGIARMDSFERRSRYALAFLIGAVITAAALRHGVHVYGGFSREEIRVAALIAIPAIALATIFFQRTRHRK
jgi:hypothetical protein